MRMGGSAEAGEITRLLRAWREGDRDAFHRLFTVLYDELKGIASLELRRTPSENTLSTAGVVHEAYLKLLEPSRTALQDRHHFLAVASKAMRHLLVDHARRRSAAKRPPEGARVGIDAATVPVDARPLDLLTLDQALGKLESVDPRLGRLVELRFFAGLTVEETAAVLDVTDRTIRREWRKARAFLHNELSKQGNS